jgi:3-hydroxyacyl-CoA dehydrogenase
MDTRKVSAVGAETMGSGIARVMAVSGLEGFGDPTYRPSPL